MSVDFLSVEDLEVLGQRILGVRYEVLDWGLLDSAANRPQATAFGDDAYPTIHDKAAALLHSLAKNHALRDGNKRLGWAACVLFYAMNDFHVAEYEDEQVAFVLAIADGSVDQIDGIAKQLRLWCVPVG